MTKRYFCDVAIACTASILVCKISIERRYRRCCSSKRLCLHDIDHCKHYGMEARPRQMIRDNLLTKTLARLFLPWIHSNMIGRTVRKCYGLIVSVACKTSILLFASSVVHRSTCYYTCTISYEHIVNHCRLSHTEVDPIQRYLAESFFKKSARMFCFGFTSIWEPLQ